MERARSARSRRLFPRRSHSTARRSSGSRERRSPRPTSDCSARVRRSARFDVDDELNGGASVTILSDALAQRLARSVDLIGRTISMDGQSFTVIGVMPPGFETAAFGWMTEHPLWVRWPHGETASVGTLPPRHRAASHRSFSIEQARGLIRVSDQLAREVDGNAGMVGVRCSIG